MEPADPEFCTALDLIVRARRLRTLALMDRRPVLEAQADELVKQAIEMMERAAPIGEGAARPSARSGG